jgi:hypothetical protein
MGVSVTHLQERHRPLFAALDPQEAQFVWTKVRERWPRDVDKTPDPSDMPDDGESLFDLCRTAGLDHARVVLSLANLNGTARPTIEKLIGRPILAWGPSVEAAQEALQAARLSRRRVAPGSGATAQGPDPGRPGGGSPISGRASRTTQPKIDNRLVASVAPQPHRAGTEMYDAYLAWRVGDTVSECRERGVLARSLRRDVRRGYVVLKGVRE